MAMIKDVSWSQQEEDTIMPLRKYTGLMEALETQATSPADPQSRRTCKAALPQHMAVRLSLTDNQA
jgi:hypothetical protein